MGNDINNSRLNFASCLALSMIYLVACQADTADLSAPQKRPNTKTKDRVAAFDGDADATRSPQPVEDTEYPQMEYRSSAGTAKASGQTSTLTHHFHTLMTKNSLTLKTTKWHSSKKEGNEAVRTWNDNTDYATVPPVASNDGRPASAANFLIFATSASNNQGTKIEFSKPLPVMVMPGPASRFEDIKKGNLEYSAQATGDGSFAISCVVSFVSESDDKITVSINYTISEPAGKRGSLYQKIPMFKSGDYRVNTKEKTIEYISGQTMAYDTKNNVSIDVDLRYNLCAKTQQGKRETFNSCQ